MLLKFSVENYKCFKSKVTLDLTATVDKKFEDNRCPDFSKYGVLKTVSVYGANASGKTTLFDAIQIFSTFVIASVGHDPRFNLNHVPFAFDPKYKGKPTSMEIDFVKSGIRYVYGFSYNRDCITEEHLYTYPKGRPKLIFERDHQKFTFKTNLRIRKDNSLRVDEKKLYVSVASQFNDTECKEVRSWFVSDLLVMSRYDNVASLDILTNRMNTDRKFNSIVKKAFKMADFGITDIKDRGKVKTSDQETSIQIPVQDIWVDHLVNGTKYHLPIFNESNGTVRFMSVIGPVIESLLNGRTLVIDEIDISFHSDLCRWIVGLFLDPAENKNNAQLIFNTHDVGLLDQNMIRRDQVWFTVKDWKSNDSELVRLSDFKIRNDLDIRKAYVNGSFGAKPFIEPGRLME